MDKWIEIDVGAIEHNLQQVRSRLTDETKLIAVVKANAYGHGAVGVAKILNRNGVDFFAVSYLEEALQLRRAGIAASILVFSPVVSEAGVREAILNRVTLTIASEKDRQLLEDVCAAISNNIKVHVKIDIGLSRFGLSSEEAIRVCREIAASQFVKAEGIYTHTADPNSPVIAEQQFQEFLQIITRLKQEGIQFPMKHIANSTLFLRSPHMFLDAVRIGTLISGQHPVGVFTNYLQLQDPYSFKSKIISIKELPKGRYLGYYRTYRLKTAAQVAVIPVGFHDGLALEVANKATGWIDLLKKLIKIVLTYFDWPGLGISIMINGKKYPVRGKVFMQMALLEIPLGIDVQIGDEVTVPVRKTLASSDIVRIYKDAEENYRETIPTAEY